MKALRRLVIYTLLALGANTATADISAVEALREGTMKKLVFTQVPAAVPDTVIYDEHDNEHRLSAFRGKYVILNFWATWCAPCRKEMPGLDALNAEFGGAGFAVVTVASGRNPVPAMQKFFAEVAIETLPLLRDPKQMLSRDLGVFGLPTTLIIDPEGREIARLRGDADWGGQSARQIVMALLAEG